MQCGLSNGTNRPLPVTLCCLEGHFSCSAQNLSKNPNHISRKMQRVLGVHYFAPKHEVQSVRYLQLNCRIDTEGLLKVNQRQS